MGRRFHENEFDAGTQIKLAIFRGYVRKWLPVFLTTRKKGRGPREVNLFDFFAGPGADAEGNPGSPRIIRDELKEFCQAHGDMKAKRSSGKALFQRQEREAHRAVGQMSERKCLSERML